MNNENETHWRLYKEQPNSKIKQKIIVNYSNLVHYVINNSKFANLNVVDEKDFFQFGIEGLSEAIDRFDPDYGTKFETYAIQRIRGKIIDELRKLQIKPRSNFDEQGNLRYTNISLDKTNDDREGYSFYEVIPAETASPEETHEFNKKKELLVNAINELSERERLILTLYYY